MANDAPDYVYQNWLKDAYQKTVPTDQGTIQLLQQMNRNLERIIELLERQGRVRPS